MDSRRMRIPAVLAVSLATLSVSASTAGAQTIGAPLNLPANTTEGCEHIVFPQLRPVVGVPPSCTFFGVDGAGQWTSQAPRGRWRIVQARVRTGPRVGPMVFTIVQAMRSQAQTGSGASGAICCTARAESQVFVPQPNSINTIPVNLPMQNTVENIDGEPVEVVDYLGISLLDLNSSVPLHGANNSSASTSYFAPAMRAGQQSLPGAFPGRTPLISADLAPGNGILTGRAAQGRGGRVILPVNVPGPGRVAATARAGVPRALLAAKRKTKRIVIARKVLNAKGPGRVNLRLKPRKAARKVLKRKRKLKATVRITYRPRGGAAVTVKRRVTFKLGQRKK
jgi:hypothetical protein